ncbi:YkvA family protein [Desulfococcus sp.]|uniref:YkvA family protein n=1 Tax=Desulfococcus sp. TaxID=2025834 RepID=UPI003593F740
MAETPDEFGIKYSDKSFWDKILKYAKVAGIEVIEKALWLYYAAQNPATPAWAKTVIYGALAYFIFPVDAIPDFTPVVGYVDDLGVLAAAVVTVSMYITDEVKAITTKKLKDWFGE